MTCASFSPISALAAPDVVGGSRFGRELGVAALYCGDDSGLWVAQLWCSPSTAAKLRSVHRLDPDEVRDEVVCRTGLTYVWDHHETRGWRALVQVQLRGRRVLVVLYLEPGQWSDSFNLGSAYEI